MSYKVDYRAMNSLHEALSKSLEALDQAMADVEGKVNSMISSGNIAGATADRMRLYFSDVHCRVIESFHKCIDSVLLLFGTYIQNYHDSVDTHPATVIETNELENILNRIIRHADDGTVIDNDVRKVIADIAGLFSPSSGIVETDADIYNQLVDDIQSLCNAIQTIETDSKDSLESIVAAQIDIIQRFLREQLQNQAMYKQNYVASSRSTVFYDMENGTLALGNMLSVNAQLVQSVAASKAQYASELQAYDKEMAERKAREEQVKAAKTAVLITTIAVTAAVTVATGGIGTAFIVGSIAAGTATGALSGGVDEWGAQYIENGNNIDWSKVGRKAVVGGIKGGIKSGITAGFGTGFDKIGDLASVSSLTHSSSALIQHGSKLGLKVAEGQVTDISSGIFDRFIDSGFEKWAENGGKLSFDFEKATHNALDKSEIAKDSAGSFAKSVTSYGATEMMNGMLDVEQITKDTVITEDIVKDSMFVTMVSKTTSGVAERGASTFTGRLMDGESLEDAFSAARKDATDPDKVGTDVIAGLASGGVSPYTAKAKAVAESKKPGYIDFEETGNTNREREILEEMYAEGELDAVEETTQIPREGSKHLPTSKTGYFEGEEGNSRFYPSSKGAQEAMSRYGQDYVEYAHDSPDFKPFSTHDSPWGEVDTEVEIGHMTDHRENPSYEYGRRPTGSSHDPNYDLGNFAQADNELRDRINMGHPETPVSSEDIERWRKNNGLTWHELADGKTMQLVPTEIHDACRHSGGVSWQKVVEAYGNYNPDADG